MWLLLLGVALAAYFYLKFVKELGYWKERGVVHVKAWPFVGSFQDFVLRRKHIMDVTTDFYKDFHGHRYVGFHQFTLPNLLLRDLDLIKQIGVKEFDHFPDHFSMANAEHDPVMSKTLISLQGDKWRRMRATLSPLFTSSKMKSMYVLISECAEDFVKHFQKKEAVAIEMKDIFTRYANDVIATTAFGIKTDSLNSPNNEFFKLGQSLTNFTRVQAFKSFLMVMAPWLTNTLRIRLFPDDLINFFRSIISETMAKREAEGIVRPDLINLLMEAKKGNLKREVGKDSSTGFATVEESHISETNQKFDLSQDEMVAQALLFFFAGFDTASTAACFTAHELAVNPEVQRKLQEEIDAVNIDYNGKAPYDVLLSMKYLDQVISETLRLWPPAFQTERLCQKEFVIEPKLPGEKQLVVEKGISVGIPIMGIHRDPDYFPEPERFDPERFSDENKGKIIPGTYLPFGIGPRNCIGSRFALLEVKALFYHLLSKFDIEAVEKTQIPLKFSLKKIQMIPEHGFWLGLRPRKLTSL